MKELIANREGITKILKPDQLVLFYPPAPPAPEELPDLVSGGSVEMWGIYLTVERSKQEVLEILRTEVE